MNLLVTVLAVAVSEMIRSMVIAMAPLGKNAAKYFTAEEKAFRYYQGQGAGNELPSSWWYGSALPFLGIEPEQPVTLVLMEPLLQGFAPDGRRLGQHQRHTDRERKVGVECVFSFDKSFSVAYVTADAQAKPKLHAALVRAVHAGLDFLDANTPRRMGKGGHTLNFEAGKAHSLFLHLSSRTNTDAHVHVHAVNYCYGIVEGAKNPAGRLESKYIYKHCHAAAALAMAELGAALQELGLSIEPTTSGKLHSWKIAQVPTSLSQALSSRSNQVREAMATEGLQGPKAADAKAVTSRPRKNDLSQEALREVTQRRCDEHGFGQEQREQMFRTIAQASFAQGSTSQSKEKVEVTVEEVLDTLAGQQGPLERRHFVRALAEANQASGASASEIVSCVDRILDSNARLEVQSDKRGQVVFMVAKREPQEIHQAQSSSSTQEQRHRQEPCLGVGDKASESAPGTVAPRTLRASQGNRAQRTDSPRRKPDEQPSSDTPSTPRRNEWTTRQERAAVARFMDKGLESRFSKPRVLVAHSEAQAGRFNAMAQGRALGIRRSLGTHVAGARYGKGREKLRVGDRVYMNCGWRASIGGGRPGFVIKLLETLKLKKVPVVAKGEFGVVEEIRTRSTFGPFIKRTLVVRMDKKGQMPLLRIPRERRARISASKAKFAVRLGYACPRSQSWKLDAEMVQPSFISVTSDVQAKAQGLMSKAAQRVRAKGFGMSR